MEQLASCMHCLKMFLISFYIDEHILFYYCMNNLMYLLPKSSTCWKLGGGWARR